MGNTKTGSEVALVICGLRCRTFGSLILSQDYSKTDDEVEHKQEYHELPDRPTTQSHKNGRDRHMERCI